MCRWHCGRLLELQREAAAGGHFEGLPGVVAEVVVIQPATGRCKREGARAHATQPWAKEGVAAFHAGCGAGVGGSGEGDGEVASKQASKQRSLCMCRLCVGCARAGLREWLVAFEARAGRLLRCFGRG